MKKFKNLSNKKVLEKHIADYKKNNELQLASDELFEFFTAYVLTKQHNLSYDNIRSSIVDGSDDGGIDVFVILVNGEFVSFFDEISDVNKIHSLQILIIQSKTTPKFEEAVLNNIISSIESLYDFDMSGDDLKKRFRPQLVDKILAFQSIWHKSAVDEATIEIKYVYSCKANQKNISKTYKAKVDQIINSTKEKLVNTNVIFQSVSSKELTQYYLKNHDLIITLQTNEKAKQITYQEGQTAYIITVNLKNYYSFLLDDDFKLRENMFEYNVRHYQGNVSVNNKIKKTIKLDHTIDFWWLNNGVTIIASKAIPKGKKLTLKNPQIVNGLQTSYIIGKFYKEKENEQRSILVKVIECNDKEVIDKIISSTNNQNNVSPALLRVTGDLQKQIENYFEVHDYYYDRRKNFYQNQGKPAERIFSLEFAAQSIQSVIKYQPAIARSKPKELWKNDSLYNSIFREDVDFQVYLNCCIVVRKVQQEIEKLPSQKTGKFSNQKTIATYFLFHIARTLVSILVKKAHYSIEDVKSLKLSKVNKTNIENARKKVEKWVKNFNNLNPSKSFLDTAKLRDFEENLNQNIRELYNNKK